MAQRLARARPQPAQAAGDRLVGAGFAGDLDLALVSLQAETLEKIDGALDRLAAFLKKEGPQPKPSEHWRWHEDGSTPPADGSSVFVFGSNLAGRHGKGAALAAKSLFGAEQGVGRGITGWAPSRKDYPVQGLYVSAADGDLAWRFYTTPNPEKKADGAASDETFAAQGNATWGDKGGWQTAGGGTVYRARDTARRLSDAEFARVLNHLDKGNVFDKAKILRDRMALQALKQDARPH